MTQKIEGYRELSPQEIAAVNRLKEAGAQLAQLLFDIVADPELPAVDRRWMDIAQTHFQQGFMAAARSITKPTTFA